MITFRCSNCKAEIEVPDSYAGRVAQCPTCSRKLRVPQPPSDRTDSRSAALPLDTSSAGSIVSLDGRVYQVRPQTEGMLIAAAAVIALSVPSLVAVGLTLRAYTPWLWAGLIATGVAAFGMLLVVPGFANLRRSRGRKSGRRFGMIALAGGLALSAAYLSLGLISYAVADHSGCRERLKAVHQALVQYAARHDGLLPPRPETLVEQGYLRASKLTCPQHPHVREGDPTYIPQSYSNRIDLRTEGDVFPDDTIVLIDSAIHRRPDVVDPQTGATIPFCYALRLRPDAQGQVVGYLPKDHIVDRLREQSRIIARVEENRELYRKGRAQAQDAGQGANNNGGADAADGEPSR